MDFDYCKIRNSTETKAELYFYGDIVSDEWERYDDEQCPSNIKRLSDEIGDRDLTIHINSGGGECFAGFAICNILRSLKGKKTVIIDGIAASIASVIAMAGDEILMPENSYIMIHKPTTGTWGTSEDFKKTATILEKIEDGIIATYMSKTVDNVTEDDIKEKVAAETWLTASEATEIFKNIVVTAKVSAAAGIGTRYYNQYKNNPLKNFAIPEKEDKTDFSEYETFLGDLEIKYK